jgi:hypothetical protein
MRKLRTRDDTEGSNKNSPGHRHPEVHLANVIPSGVEKFRGVTHGQIHGMSRLRST